MQFKFLTALLLVGACFVQTSIAHPQSLDEVQLRGIIDDMIQKAKEAIEYLQKLIVDQVKAALDKFNNFKDTVIKTAEEYLDKAKEHISEFLDSYKSRVEKFVEEAKKAGVDVQECVADDSEKFQNLGKQTFENVKNCVKKEIDQAQKIIGEGNDIVHSFLETIQALPSKLGECGTGVSSISCISSVIVEAVKLQADLPIKITIKIEEVAVLVAGFYPRLASCGTSALTQATAEATQIVVKVGECVANKIKESEGSF